MSLQIDTNAVAGTEFDQWLDYEGTASGIGEHSMSDTLMNSNDIARSSLYPISPSSTANGDNSSSALRVDTYTALSVSGPLTPSHTSGSPETFPGSQGRLSGETLHDENSVYRHTSLKRKLSSTDVGLSTEQKVPRGKIAGSKRPHNVIEKRYRANLNEKIAELRDSVPSLRTLQKARNKDGGSVASDDDDLDGLTPSGKLNKASILTKAVEYIRHLELRTRRLEDENKSLKDRLHTLDRVLAKGGCDAERVAAFTTDDVIEQSSAEEEAKPSKADINSQARPEGLIPVPEGWRSLRQNQSQEHYGQVYQNGPKRSRLGGKWSSRIMIGSLAGLMLMEGFSEHDQGTDSREKGLFGIPLEILDGWTFLRSPRVYLAMFAEYCRGGGIIPLVKGFMALTILAFFIFTYLFNSRPHPARETDKEAHVEPQSARPASPIEVRRRAWSTSMQALHLPHHSFFPEWLALTYEWANYSLRWLIGPRAYASLTGHSAEDEVARIKAWDIAIDAQLAGGDIEISRSRAVLTIFGSGTLPQTPMRLMQKALHCRVLLWNVGLPGTAMSALANYAATLFANRQWRTARRLHEQLPAGHSDRLPGYLNYLLQMECDDVFEEMVTQRASNLMYDRPTSEYAECMLMDVVVEDHAIRSPLDAIAAWRSTSALQEALETALQKPDSPDTLREHVQAALEIAPPGSAAETRALAVHAVLSPGRRSAFYNKAKDAMTTIPKSQSSDSTVPSGPLIPFFIDSSTPTSARPDIAVSLLCAEIMLTLEQERDLAKALNMAAKLSDSMRVTATLLTTASVYFVLYRLWRASGAQSFGPEQCSIPTAKLSALLSTLELAAPTEREARVLRSCIDFLRKHWVILSAGPTPAATPSRRSSMVSNDTGYASLSEQESEVYAQNISKSLRSTTFNITVNHGEA